MPNRKKNDAYIIDTILIFTVDHVVYYWLFISLFFSIFPVEDTYNYRLINRIKGKLLYMV